MLVREGSQLRRAKIADYLRLGVVVMKNKVVKLRNQFARDLRTPKYRKRVVSSKKTYTRKVKHK